jgi:tripartite-type tricarboxylate transporter receptor subunit TctC
MKTKTSIRQKIEGGIELRKLAIVLACLLALVSVIMTGCQTPQPTTTATPTATATATPTATPTPTAWQPTKAITIIVMNNAGGGYDTYARVITGMMTEKKFVTQPIVVENQGGAGGTIGMVQLYRAKPDGYTMAIMDAERRSQDIIGGNTDFDLDKITYLAACNKQVNVTIVAAKSQFKTNDDMVKFSQTGIMRGATTDPGASEKLLPVISGWKNFKYVTGYGGSGDCMLSIIKGDTEFANFPDSTVLQNVKAGEIRALCVWSDTPSRVFEAEGIKVPTAIDYGVPKLAALGSVRAFIAPPGMDPAIAKYWETTFLKTMNDPDTQAKAIAAKIPIDVFNAADAKKMCQDLFGVYQQFKDVLTAK